MPKSAFGVDSAECQKAFKALIYRFRLLYLNYKTMYNQNPEIPVVLEDIPESEQQALLEKLAQWIVRRSLTAPAIMFLETGKPLNFLGSQLLIAFSPFVQAFFKGDQYHKIALILEKDENVELLIQLIEKSEG